MAEREINVQSRGFLSPTFMSVATAGGATYFAVTSEAAQTLTSTGDKAILGAAVFLGAYLGCKIGVRLGSLAGLLGGGAAGAAAGGSLGALLGRDAETAAGGAVAGGASLGIVMAIVGSLAGFWGGAVLGHNVSKGIAMDYLNEENGVTTEPAANDAAEEEALLDIESIPAQLYAPKMAA